MTEPSAESRALITAGRRTLRGRISELETNLAAMRAVVEAARREHTPPHRFTPCSVCAALAASPGAAWLATAREIIDALNRLHAAVTRKRDDFPEMTGFLWDQAGERAVEDLVALLARPEVQWWAGR